MQHLRLAVIGVGHLGKEHARILAGLPDVELVGVADAQAAQAEAIARRCSSVAFQDYRALLSQIDAAVIAVPTIYHHAIAGEFLRRGIAVLVEKPLASTLSEADELVEIAQRSQTILQVGHIERFNPAVEELQRHPLQPKFITTERVGSFTGRSMDIGVVLDLMIHDLDLVQMLAASPVKKVEALGVSILGGHEDMAHARLTFANGCIAHLSASRVNSAPLRRMQVWGPEGYAELDFARRHLTLVQPSELLRHQRLSSRPLDSAAIARFKTEMLGGHIERFERDCNSGDQLTRELQGFLHCVRTGGRPRVSGEDGRNALGLAMRVIEGIQNHAWTGQPHGPIGPLHLPEPAGLLFQMPDRSEAA